MVITNLLSGTTRIVVGTDCFTWGVDVPDIRNVVVFGLPTSFSKLVQQIGRAGQDGKQAYATTYAPQWVEDIPDDLEKSTKQEVANLKRREAMSPVLRHWFNSSPESCPRTIFCAHFGEPPSQPNNCCLHHHHNLPSMEPTESRIQQYSAKHTETPKVRSDGTYKSFRNKEFAPLRDSASRMIAVWARQTWQEVCGENTLLPSTAFFPEALQKRLSEKINMVTSHDQLSLVLHDWNHLSSHKTKLFKFCQEMLKGLEDLRQGLEDPDEMAVDDEEVQPVVPIKIKILAPKKKAHDREPASGQLPKRQCRR